MHSALLIIVPALLAGAQAERLAEITLNPEEARKFSQSLAPSIVSLEIVAKVGEYVDRQTLARHKAVAVPVRDSSGRVRLLTSGLLTQEAASVQVRTRSDRLVEITEMRPLGNGALVELVFDDKALSADLSPLELAAKEQVKQGLPVFMVLGFDSPFPQLVRASLLHRLDKPWESLMLSDSSFPYGTPLFTAHGRLAGQCFRPHPKERKLSLAITADAIDAWLHSKDSTTDSRPATH